MVSAFGMLEFLFWSTGARFSEFGGPDEGMWGDEKLKAEGLEWAVMSWSTGLSFSGLGGSHARELGVAEVVGLELVG